MHRGFQKIGPRGPMVFKNGAHITKYGLNISPLWPTYATWTWTWRQLTAAMSTNCRHMWNFTEKLQGCTLDNRCMKPWELGGNVPCSTNQYQHFLIYRALAHPNMWPRVAQSLLRMFVRLSICFKTRTERGDSGGRAGQTGIRQKNWVTPCTRKF